MSKHFKGPLEAVTVFQYKPGTFDHYLQKVEILGPVKESGWQTYVASIAVHNMTEEQAIATGQLFASAPEMLELLEKIKRSIETYGSADPSPIQMIADVETVINKAKGQAST